MLNQTIVFFSVIIWGFFIGVIFDCYRTIRQLWRPGLWGTSLGDLFFWLLVTATTYFYLMLISWGEVRFYVFLGMGMGLIIYFRLISKTVRRFWFTVLFYSKSFFLYLYKVISKPLQVFCKIGLHLKKGVFRLM